MHGSSASFIQHQDGLVLRKIQADDHTACKVMSDGLWAQAQPGNTSGLLCTKCVHWACGMRLRAYKLHPVTPFGWGPSAFVLACLSSFPVQLLLTEARPCDDSWDSGAQLPGTSSTLVVLSRAYPSSPWLIAARTQLRSRVKSSCVSKAKMSQTTC